MHRYETVTPGEYRPVRGLFDSIRHFLDTLGSLAQSRLELMTAEVQEHIYRALGVIVRSVATLLASCIGLMMLSIALILAVAANQRPWVAGGIAIVFLLLAVLLSVSVWLELREQARLLRLAIDQFRKDGAALNVIHRWQDTSP